MRLDMKKVILLLTWLVMSHRLAVAHPGDLDANGGHIDHRTGLYHFHRKAGSKGVVLPAPTAAAGRGGELYGEMVASRQFVGECIKVMDGDSITVMKPVPGGRVASSCAWQVSTPRSSATRSQSRRRTI